MLTRDEIKARWEGRCDAINDADIFAQAALAADIEEDKTALVDALRDGTKDALDVAAAVAWCEKNANLVELKAGGKWLVDDGWHNAVGDTLPAAVAALRERTKGETE